MLGHRAPLVLLGRQFHGPVPAHLANKWRVTLPNTPWLFIIFATAVSSMGNMTISLFRSSVDHRQPQRLYLHYHHWDGEGCLLFCFLGITSCPRLLQPQESDCSLPCWFLSRKLDLFSSWFSELSDPISCKIEVHQGLVIECMLCMCKNLVTIFSTAKKKQRKI